jgi:hypothetical protein
MVWGGLSKAQKKNKRHRRFNIAVQTLQPIRKLLAEETAKHPAKIKLYLKPITTAVNLTREVKINENTMRVCLRLLDLDKFRTRDRYGSYYLLSIQDFEDTIKKLLNPAPEESEGDE